MKDFEEQAKEEVNGVYTCFGACSYVLTGTPSNPFPHADDSSKEDESRAEEFEEQANEEVRIPDKCEGHCSFMVESCEIDIPKMQ